MAGERAEQYLRLREGRGVGPAVHNWLESLAGSEDPAENGRDCFQAGRGDVGECSGKISVAQGTLRETVVIKREKTAQAKYRVCVNGGIRPKAKIVKFKRIE